MQFTVIQHFLQGIFRYLESKLYYAMIRWKNTNASPCFCMVPSYCLLGFR